MFCKNCGTKLEDSVKFCENCGNAVAELKKTMEEAKPSFETNMQSSDNSSVKTSRYSIDIKGVRQPYYEFNDWRFAIVSVAVILFYILINTSDYDFQNYGGNIFLILLIILITLFLFFNKINPRKIIIDLSKNKVIKSEVSLIKYPGKSVSLDDVCSVLLEKIKLKNSENSHFLFIFSSLVFLNGIFYKVSLLNSSNEIILSDFFSKIDNANEFIFALQKTFSETNRKDVIFSVNDDIQVIYISKANRNIIINSENEE